MEKYVIYLRIILRLLLLWGVYGETGIWTTASLFLILAYVEVETWLKKKGG